MREQSGGAARIVLGITRHHVFYVGNRSGKIAQLNLQVNHPHMGRIEDGHMIILHMIGYYFMDADRTQAQG